MNVLDMAFLQQQTLKFHPQHFINHKSNLVGNYKNFNWSFLLQVIRKFELSVAWIKGCKSPFSFAVLVNI